MFRFLEKTRNKPDKEKYPTLVALSLIIMVFVIIGWIFLVKFFPKEKSGNNDREVFSVIKDTFSNTFNGLEKGYKDTKNNVENFFNSN